MRNENVTESKSQSQNEELLEVKQPKKMDSGVQGAGKTPSKPKAVEGESQQEECKPASNARETIINIVKKLLDIFCL
jgi:hypothetical protein